MSATRRRDLAGVALGLACGLSVAGAAAGLEAATGAARGAVVVADTAVLEAERWLLSRPIALPVPGVSAAALRDTFLEGRPGHPHEAIDIEAPRGTKVFAVDNGRLAKLFNSVAGGLTVYQFDPQDRIAYYYAHLDRYADGLREGMVLHRCDLLGYVGTSGNAPATAPHLHFAVFRLGPEHKWWKGAPLNPYPALRAAAAPGSVASCK